MVAIYSSYLICCYHSNCNYICASFWRFFVAVFRIMWLVELLIELSIELSIE